MHLEERQELLEKEVESLKKQITYLLDKGAERWVTPTELAEMMGCSRNTIYIKIRSGEIKATRATGDPRIPMSQFYDDDDDHRIVMPKQKVTKQSQSLKDRVFGC